MAIILPTSTTSASIVISNADVAESDLLWVRESVELISTSSTAISISRQNLDMKIDGDVVANDYGVRLTAAQPTQIMNTM